MVSARPWRHLYAASTALLIGCSSLAVAQAAAKPTKQLTAADLKAWKSIRTSALSNDGK
jgi:hypothetical protein